MIHLIVCLGPAPKPVGGELKKEEFSSAEISFLATVVPILKNPDENLFGGEFSLNSSVPICENPNFYLLGVKDACGLTNLFASKVLLPILNPVYWAGEFELKTPRLNLFASKELFASSLGAVFSAKLNEYGAITNVRTELLTIPHKSRPKLSTKSLLPSFLKSIRSMDTPFNELKISFSFLIVVDLGRLNCLKLPPGNLTEIVIISTASAI